MELFRYRPYSTNNNGINYDKEGLINSEIYFASLSQLNDPMEGYTKIDFQGDLIIWKNLFKNYFRSLFEAFTFSIISMPIPTDSRDLFEPNVIAYQLFDERFQNLFDKDWFQELPSQFISENIVSSLIENLHDKHISEQQLTIFLKIIHNRAISIILNYLQKNNILKGTIELPTKGISYDINWKDIFQDKILNDRKLYQLLEQFFNSIGLLNENIDKRSKFLFLDFPSLFIEKLKKLMYPDFYVASFTKNPCNSSMWGNYANSHKGICLKFDFKDNELPLFVPYGFTNQVLKKFIGYSTRKINYSNKLYSLNFFENIGNVSGGVLDRIWLLDSDTKERSIVKQIDENTRNDYWNFIYDVLSQKTLDWKYEQEERILLNNMFGDFSEQKDRKIKYDFNYLSGIIWGLRTSDADKREIIEIIINKCKEIGREDFKFYQSFYNEEKCNIDYREDPINSFIKL